MYLEAKRDISRILTEFAGLFADLSIKDAKDWASSYIEMSRTLSDCDREWLDEEMLFILISDAITRNSLNTILAFFISLRSKGNSQFQQPYRFTLTESHVSDLLCFEQHFVAHKEAFSIGNLIFAHHFTRNGLLKLIRHADINTVIRVIADPLIQKEHKCKHIQKAIMDRAFKSRFADDAFQLRQYARRYEPSQSQSTKRAINVSCLADRFPGKQGDNDLCCAEN
ncbi:hypothetical protein [Reinekea sp. G2M2-21]|uniref:hypothetical protein n=1 Tax=Reinekea sp. G2M2-21 TaxID=2788942 RepID=UPI0018A99673|nr:hypothetical protein [Reinekea sp. G2M2-21]